MVPGGGRYEEEEEKGQATVGGVPSQIIAPIADDLVGAADVISFRHLSWTHAPYILLRESLWIRLQGSEDPLIICNNPSFNPSEPIYGFSRPVPKEYSRTTYVFSIGLL